PRKMTGAFSSSRSELFPQLDRVRKCTKRLDPAVRVVGIYDISVDPIFNDLSGPHRSGNGRQPACGSFVGYLRAAFLESRKYKNIGCSIERSDIFNVAG